MNIGIDVDGVMVDLYGWIEKKMKKYSRKLFGRKVYDKNAKHIYERYGLTREQDEEFWAKYIWEYSQNAKLFKGLKKYFKLLSKDGHKLYIITSRYHAGKDTEDGERMRALIEGGLEKAGLVYDKIIYTSESGGKIAACRKYKIDIMIDDSSWNIFDLHKFVFCIVYDSKFNKWIEGENIKHAKDWRGVYSIIKNFKKESK